MLNQLDELFEVLIGISDKLNYRGDEICKNMAGFCAKMRDALMAEGFSREETIQLICRLQQMGGGK